MSGKTIFIGLDGATFAILDPLMNQGYMPFLKMFLASGVRAELHSIIPPLTAPAWTSLLTGRSPGHHGIFDFFQLDTPGSKQIRLATSRDVRCPTVGHIANRHGLRTTFLNFPVMLPPPELDGYVISGWMPQWQLHLGCHPADLYERLKVLPGFNAQEFAMNMELEAKAKEGCQEDELAAWIEHNTRREQHWLKILHYLMGQKPADLTAILFDGLDKIQHLCWRFLDPGMWPADPSPEERKIRDLCLNYFQQLDQLLAEIVITVGTKATIVIASAYGFGTSTEVFHINAWLEQAGWPEEYEQFRAELPETLYNFIDSTMSKLVTAHVWLHEELFSGPAAALAPDLILTLRNGGLVSILPAGNLLQPSSAPMGSHQPLGIFMARGPGFQRNATLPELSILDVAPLLLYSLGLDVPDDLEGHVPLELYEPSYQAKRHNKIIPADNGHSAQSARPAMEIVCDAEAEALLLARLRALGYIE